MFKLIVGLGNPTQQYEKTRHNAGFLFLDELASEFNSRWQHEVRFEGNVSNLQFNGNKVWLLKPTTFMNRSGQSVGKLARYHKISPQEILIVHDELDFDVGMFRLKKAGGHAGHNGLKDIISHLGSNDFYRLRIGIGRPYIGRDVANYVLSQLSEKDLEVILFNLEKVKIHIKQIVMNQCTAEQIMNLLNSEN